VFVTERKRRCKKLQREREGGRKGERVRGRGGGKKSERQRQREREREVV